MVRLVRHMLLAATAVLALGAGTAYAQTGQIAGRATDSSGAALPGVLVEATSPALIEKVRSVTTDANGRFQIINLPVGRYKVTFKLASFGTVEQSNIDITTDYTAPVNAEMKVGGLTDVVNVQATAGIVDVQNARQRQVITGEELRDLPTTRDLAGLIGLVPGIQTTPGDFSQTSAPNICSGGSGQGATTGGQSGCSPMLSLFNAHSSMNDTASLARGRIQVDGMNIMGVGDPNSFDAIGRTPYLADVQNAQEITFTLSGGLGESETGGTTINIIPRTGGNRYAGNFFMSYADQNFYDRNEGTRNRTPAGGLPFSLANQLDHDYDTNGSYGGPILRDRLWFQAGARYRGRETFLPSTYYNLNEGIPGANFAPDTSAQANSTEIYRNANLRLTLQASQRNKFNIFWDEQYTCANPCEGTQNGFTSPEAQGTSLTYPLHVAQLGWTSPLTNQILLNAGFSWNAQANNQTSNRFLPGYDALPRVNETGAGVEFGNKTSGSVNNANYTNTDRWETNASASYVTGSHNAKIGYNGSYLFALQRNKFNDMQVQYGYVVPEAPSVCVTATCLAEAAAPTQRPGVTLATNAAGVTGVQVGCFFNEAYNPVPAPVRVAGDNSLVARPWCGAINLPGNPNDLNNSMNTALKPIPTSVTQYIPVNLDQAVEGHSVYIQDQWTLNRVTLNGAVRYDLGTSHFNETCVGGQFMAGRSFCLNSPSAADGYNGEGVEFQDITPRWGVAWDVFGTGRTSVKWNMGKYVGGAVIGGIYTTANPAGPGRTVTNFNRPWSDHDGDRVIDCDLNTPVNIPPANTAYPGNGECGEIPAANVANWRRFGRSPTDLDEAQLAIGLSTIQCGRNDSTQIAQSIIDYCADYMAKGGSTMLNGWNKRQYEWQFGLGVQHELLPRMSVEVTYNRRWSKNTTLNDAIGVGCDLYNSTEYGNPDACMEAFLNHNSSTYDFYTLNAPFDANLPGGGGYPLIGFLDRKPCFNASGAVVTCTADTGPGTTAQTLDKDNRRVSYWRGVDVNMTLRARGGLRLTGGTSTGGQYVDNCRAIVDGVGSTTALVKFDERECAPDRPFQTNVRGTATYTIPWIDVLFSSTFSYRPGVEQTANYAFPLSQVQWMPGSEYRATNTAGCGTNPAGCLLSNPAAQTVTQDLLANDTYGEGIRMFDIKLAKNIRFGGKRLNIGMDIYNVFNSDAALGYCTQYPTCTQNGQVQPWPSVTSLATPRFARFQMQFDF